MPPPLAAAPPAPVRAFLGLAVAIRPIQGAAIALQLAADRAAAAAKHPRDRSCRVAFLPQQRQRIPIRRGELAVRHGWLSFLDRKSTRLNSSHVKISYAVFCL